MRGIKGLDWNAVSLSVSLCNRTTHVHTLMYIARSHFGRESEDFFTVFKTCIEYNKKHYFY